MDPIAIASGLILILKPVLSYIRERTEAGEIPAEEQRKLWQELDDIRSGKAFSGPEWKRSDKP